MSKTALFDRVEASVRRQSAMTTIGAELTEAVEGRVVITLPMADHILQQNRFIHGGVIGMILDSACGYAALTRTPDHSTILTSEYKINLLAPAMGERIEAVGTVLRAGRRLIVTQGDAYAVTGRERKHIAVMLASLMVVEKVPGMVD